MNDGSIFVCLVAATFAMVIAGVIIYSVYKWARKVQDGSPVPFPGITNSDAIPTPGNGCDITGAWWQDQELTMTWWDGSTASPIPQEEPPASTNCVIYGSLDGTNMLLSIQRKITTNYSVKFSDIGIPVDAYGLPYDFNWHWNQPAGEPENWILQRTTNLTDWEDVCAWQVWGGYTNSWTESQEVNYLYRAHK